MSRGNPSDVLKRLIDTAARKQAEAHGEETKPEAAVRYAVLKRLEAELDLPVMVKYGDDEAVCKMYGRDDDQVWAIRGGEGYARFRIEHTATLQQKERRRIDKTMLAIGAMKLGDTGKTGNHTVMETHYLWPLDSPIVEIVDDWTIQD